MAWSYRLVKCRSAEFFTKLKMFPDIENRERKKWRRSIILLSISRATLRGICIASHVRAQ